MKTIYRWLAVCALLLLSQPTRSQVASAPPASPHAFVARAGTRLTLEGKNFRYSGPNVEWLGLEGYGPHDPEGPRLPSHFEIDDAFDTAAEMGAKVVRSQTIGDTVGCPLCIEPTLGNFNQKAFAASDYAIAAAAAHGMRLIVPLIGDCAACAGGGIGQYLAWAGKADYGAFFEDPQLIAAYERHIDAVLNHLNPLTGLRYKDDPTIMAWENCNMCGIFAILAHGNVSQVASWSETIGKHIKAVDPRHLYLDTTGILRSYPGVLDNPSTDLVTFEEYPHWDALLGVGSPPTTAETIAHDAAAVVAHGKVFIVNEYGWDRTDWKTAADFAHVLDVLATDQDIAGDGFWALQAHLDNFGFQPIPADARDPAFAARGECGEWWALYYPGIKTLVMPAEEMAGRAQQLRTHAYAMSGVPLPKHALVASPVITSTVLGGLVAWRGVAGATRYSVERLDPNASTWTNICDRCATDTDDPWPDPAGTKFGAAYRVTAWNADGIASAPSAPR